MTTTTTTEAPYVHNLKHVLHLSLMFFEAQRKKREPIAVFRHTKRLIYFFLAECFTYLNIQFYNGGHWR